MGHTGPGMPGWRPVGGLHVVAKQVESVTILVGCGGFRLGSKTAVAPGGASWPA